MNTTWKVILPALALLVASPAFAKCKYPHDPDIPVGTKAGRDEMVAGQKALKQYIADVETYLACLDEKDAAAGEEQTEEQNAMYVKKYNAAVDAMEKNAAEFNYQLQQYKKLNQ